MYSKPWSVLQKALISSSPVLAQFLLLLELNSFSKEIFKLITAWLLIFSPVIKVKKRIHYGF